MSTRGRVYVDNEKGVPLVVTYATMCSSFCSDSDPFVGWLHEKHKIHMDMYELRP